LPRSKPAQTTPLAAGLAMLARRPYSAGAMRRALEKKFPNDSEAVREALTRLRELGYLNDARFAEHAASTLVRNRAFGRRRIRLELKRKLLDYRTIEPALTCAFEETSERAVLEKALDKKLRGMRLPLTPRKLQSLVASLLRRGFNGSDIIKAVRARPELKPVAENVKEVEIELEGEKL
jgi:regulatory protein